MTSTYDRPRGSCLLSCSCSWCATVAIGNYLPGYGQTWSLAIEEHFYFVWPLVLLWLLGRRGLDAVLRVTLLAAAAALVWRTVLLFGTDAPTLLLYHGSLERADALLYGCGAAVAVRMGWVGLVSYGIYLWHWPLLSMSLTLGYDHLVARILVGFVLTPAVAAASYYFFERPVRARVRRRLGGTGSPPSSPGSVSVR